VHPIVVVKASGGDAYWRGGADELLLLEPSAVVS
jgi:hypothetical protein